MIDSCICVLRLKRQRVRRKGPPFPQSNSFLLHIPYDLHLLLPLPHVSRHSSDHHEPPPVTNQSANVLRPLANLFI